MSWIKQVLFYLGMGLICSLPVKGSVGLVMPDTLSLRGDERYLARTVPGRIEKWLTELSIPVRKIQQGNLSNQSLKDLKLCILPYNPSLSDLEVQALERHIQRGGKIAVFQNNSALLADVMQVKLKGLRSSSKAGHWSSIRFMDSLGELSPKRIDQHAWHIFPVQPQKESKTIAYWYNEQGKAVGDGAVVESPFGWWFSQVLLDGYHQKKKQLLISMICQCDPGIMGDVTPYFLKEVEQFASYTSLQEATYAIQAAARYHAKRQAIELLLERVIHAHKKAKQYQQEGKHVNAVTTLIQCKRMLQNAFSFVQEPLQNKKIAIWDHHGVGYPSFDWEQTARTLASFGIKVYYPNMLWTGKAHFSNRYAPPSKTMEQFGDQLAPCIEACHAHGIEVHLWKVCWKLNNAPSFFIENMKKQGRLQIDAQGETIPWLCPSQPRNRALELDAIRDALKHYPVDGIHLDYIRYPHRHACYCNHTQKAFEKKLGRTIANWPKPVLHGAELAKEFELFRASEITSFVEEVSSFLKKEHPNVELSAAVFGKYPSCKYSVAQDYASWLKEGLIDYLVPMNYTSDPDKLAAWLNVQVAMGRAPEQVLCGIGVESTEAELSVEETIIQIQRAMQLRSGGVALYKLSPYVMEDILPVLSKGLLMQKESGE